jgi:hypothetical protein
MRSITRLSTLASVAPDVPVQSWANGQLTVSATGPDGGGGRVSTVVRPMKSATATSVCGNSLT